MHPRSAAKAIKSFDWLFNRRHFTDVDCPSVRCDGNHVRLTLCGVVSTAQCIRMCRRHGPVSASCFTCSGRVLMCSPLNAQGLFAHCVFSLWCPLHSIDGRLAMLVSCRRIHVNSQNETKAICQVNAPAERLHNAHPQYHKQYSGHRAAANKPICPMAACVFFVITIVFFYVFFSRVNTFCCPRARPRTRESHEVIAASLVPFVCVRARVLASVGFRFNANVSLALIWHRIEVPAGQRRSISSL